MSRCVVVALVVVLSSVSTARAQDRGPAIWTATGAGAGFGVGLWAGLSAFDDAVNSDRKVWTSAFVGAGVGAVAGYLIGKARRDHRRPAVAPNVASRNRPYVIDPKEVARSFRFRSSRVDGGRQPVTTSGSPSRARP